MRQAELRVYPWYNIGIQEFHLIIFHGNVYFFLWGGKLKSHVKWLLPPAAQFSYDKRDHVGNELMGQLERESE